MAKERKNSKAKAGESSIVIAIAEGNSLVLRTKKR